MRPVCYLGDDDASRAAAYLCGVLKHFGIPVERVPSGTNPPDDFSLRSYSAYIVSDYPSVCWGKTEPQAAANLAHVAAAVRCGAGLLMLGGWESYHGLKSDGEYNATPLAEVLPIQMLAEDDRRNFSQPCLICCVTEHPITQGLPWNESPPGIGGVNLFTAKSDAQTVLEAVPFHVTRTVVSHALRTLTPTELSATQPVSNGLDLPMEWTFTPQRAIPLLVVGQCAKGRTAALATDVAPHWVGGFVDWGTPRIYQLLLPQDFPELSNAGFIEVGGDYARFFQNLVRWVAGADAREIP